MVRPEEMNVPQNVREKFDTSEINTDINVLEEIAKESYYADKPYIPTPDPRSVNAVAKIKEGIPFHDIKDEPVCATTAAVMMRTMIMEDLGITPAPMSLEALKAAIALGGEVKLTGDVVINEPLVIEKDVIINLNNFRMTIDYKDNYAFVAKGCDVVIEGTGFVDVTGYGFSTSMSAPGNITVNCGIFNAKDCSYLFGCFGGSIVFNDGVFNGEYCVVNNFAPYYGKEAVVVINDGVFSVTEEDGAVAFCLDKEGNVVPEGVVIEGGKFNTLPEEFLAEGKTSVVENGLFVVA